MMATDPDDKFQFVFTQLDAIEAVADLQRRAVLGRAFGVPDVVIRANRCPRAALEGAGYHLDPLTLTWFPRWWPEWSHD